MRSAHSRARRFPQLGQSPRALHEKGRVRSAPQSSQRSFKNPKWGSPHFENPLEEIDDAGGEGTVSAGKALVVDALQILEVLLGDAFEDVRGWTRAVAGETERRGSSGFAHWRASRGQLVPPGEPSIVAGEV